MDKAPLYFEEEGDVNYLINTIKSLFDNSDKNVRVNREGFLENTFMLESVETDYHDENYITILGNLLIEKLHGLSFCESNKKVLTFYYNGEKVQMKQYVNYRGDCILFVFTRLTFMGNSSSANGLDS
jgi:hypothetical protein